MQIGQHSAGSSWGETYKKKRVEAKSKQIIDGLWLKGLMAVCDWFSLAF